MNKSFFSIVSAILFLILVACGGTKPESYEVNAMSSNESADSM